MAQKTTGLYKRKGIYHLDKMYLGERIRGTCETDNYDQALEVLAERMKEVRDAKLFGVRPKRIWRDAAAHYLKVKQKRSLAHDADQLVMLDPWIGDLPLDQVYDETLEPFAKHRLTVDKVKRKTVNASLEVVRHILYLCAAAWRENRVTWLAQAPKITLLKVTDAAKPYPLTWVQQRKLFSLLPGTLAKMALFKVNTGTREQEVCQLRWEWEHEIPGATVFIVPEGIVKNAEERLIVLNRFASSVIESQRGIDDEFVFLSSRGEPYQKMNNNPWRQAWIKAGLPVDPRWTRGVHNLKHTFGQRLRAAGVSEEDRMFLLGHRNSSLTTHYSAPEINYFIEQANKVCEQRREVILRKVS